MLRLAFFAVLMLGVAAPAAAGPNEALAAYKKGDYKTALAEWRDLADLGIVRAQYYVGTMYLNGQGTKTDPDTGAKYIEKAARDGYPPAQQIYGTLHHKGRGVKKNLIEAYGWLGLAVLQGRKKAGPLRDKVWWELTPPQIAEARLRLAELVALDRTGLGDDKKSAKIIRAVAETGDAEAQFKLAERYFDGRGVPLDPVEGYKWHTLAAFRGNAKAQAMDSLMQSYMTRKQIDEATARAAKWTPCGKKQKRKCPK